MQKLKATPSRSHAAKNNKRNHKNGSDLQATYCEKKHNKKHETNCACFHKLSAHVPSPPVMAASDNAGQGSGKFFPADADADANAQDSAESMRLNRAIASGGICSRRKADQLVFDGKVTVNDEIITNPGHKVTPADIVLVDGRRVNLSPALTCIILNKPIHTVCTMSDPQGRQTVIDLLPDELRMLRLFPVGRLDYFSEGLLILTNDGRLAQALAHPRHHQPKVYEVLIRGQAQEADLQAMRSGMRLNENLRLLPVRVTAKTLMSGNTLLTMELVQGINRQIRRMCDALNLTILRLVRIAQATLTLGSLPSGKWRKLTQQEMAQLQKSLGLTRP